MRVRQLGDPILREVSKPLAKATVLTSETQALIINMQEVLDGIKAISDENGNAIAAPQVGRAVRLILLRLNGEFVPMINPQLTVKSVETFACEEECFSFYNLRAKVRRHCEVEVSYLDQSAQTQRLIMRGEDSALVQHEIDHLDGIFFVDRVADTKQIYSIDFALQNNLPRLQQVKEMMAYMVGRP